MPNSQSNSKSGGGSLASTGENGFLGASYQCVDTRYGVPFVEEGGTTLHPRRHRVDLRGEKRNLGGFISGVRFVGGFRDYKHDEIEASGDIATSFTNKSHRGQPLPEPSRVRGAHGHLRRARRAQRLQHGRGGSAGAADDPERLSGFLYEELTYRHFALQFGGRVDRTSFDPDGAAAERPDVPKRDFTNFSASIGLLGLPARRLDRWP